MATGQRRRDRRADEATRDRRVEPPHEMVDGVPYAPDEEVLDIAAREQRRWADLLDRLAQ